VQHARLAWGCLYVAGFLAWARVFRERVEPRLRRMASAMVGEEVLWSPLSTFPLEVYAWSACGPASRRLEGPLGLAWVGLSFSASLVPILVLSAVLRWTTWIPVRLSEALYLATPALLLTFVALQTRRPRPPAEAAPERSSPLEKPSQQPRRGTS
jgi:hypothetical protein